MRWGSVVECWRGMLIGVGGGQRQHQQRQEVCLQYRVVSRGIVWFPVLWAIAENQIEGGGEKRGCPIGVFQVPVSFSCACTKLACTILGVVCSIWKFQFVCLFVCFLYLQRPGYGVVISL